MTREEQAKKECAIVVSDDIEYGTPFARGYNKGIEAGVKWADANPNWHKYPNEKPSKPSEDTVYPVTLYNVYDGDDIYTSSWDGNNFIYFSDDEIFIPDTKVIAWMELPEAPKFD